MSAEAALALPIVPTGPQRSGNGSVMDDNATVPKAAGLIQVKEQVGSLSLQDQKIINVLLYYSHDNIGDPNAVHEVPLQDLREYLGRHDSNDRVRASLVDLSRVHLTFDAIDTDGNHQWGAGSLIVVSGHEVGQDGLVRFTWPHWLRPLLSEPAKWARLSLPVVRAFKSKYGVRLYENLEMVANRQVKEWIVSVENLRVLLGVGERLAGWGALYRRAVAPALEEVNRHADFMADWEVYRQRGRKVVMVRFLVSKKSERESREHNGRAKRLNRGGAVVLKAETYDLARRFVPGIDIYAVEAEYKAWCQGKPRPTNPDGAFVRFVQKWARNRQGKLFGDKDLVDGL